MDKKGIIAIGPTVILVNLVVLIVATAKIVLALGLVSGIVFNKKIKEAGWKFLLPRIIVFVLLTALLIVCTHLVVGPEFNHHLAMLFAAVPFIAITTLLSINSFKQDVKETLTAIGVLTILFIIVSQLSVWLVYL